MKISLLVILSLILIFLVLSYIRYKATQQEMIKKHEEAISKEMVLNSVGNKELSEQSIKSILKNKTYSPFEIYDLSYEYDEANYVHLLKGSIKNNSDNNYYRVSLNFDLLNIHGIPIDNSSWHIESFSAHEERSFSLTTYDNEITSVELNNINSVLAQ